MKTILTVVGARPQFVKAASISRALKTHRCFREVIVHTGQHFDPNMSDVFFDEMDIPKPDFDLNIHSLSHGAMTGRMMEGLEALMLGQKPDLVLIYGDTNSTLAGALTARKLNIPVAHVEAGLRSFNMLMPEEVNRIISDRISSVLYCPTHQAKSNLLQEGFANFAARILVSGDVMYDAAIFYAQKAASISRIREKLGLTHYILCTLHRAENTDNPERLSSICRALDKLATQFQIALPLHPRTRQIMKRSRIELSFQPLDPVGYFDMI
ncbi:MAG TPA: UDP-N-acetylglucosamine 2-epimerase (non-hydrolyzing), partial [Saprospiraceae bacterium]|nr:UDP-N-acetylglucosamine 2-epimerase (non-hydrolyzing) [Saprospiraceae bacterium]